MGSVVSTTPYAVRPMTRATARVTACLRDVSTRGHPRTLRERCLAKHLLQSRGEGPRMTHVAHMVTGKLHNGRFELVRHCDSILVSDILSSALSSSNHDPSLGRG